MSRLHVVWSVNKMHEEIVKDSDSPVKLFKVPQPCAFLNRLKTLKAHRHTQELKKQQQRGQKKRKFLTEPPENESSIISVPPSPHQNPGGRLSLKILAPQEGFTQASSKITKPPYYKKVNSQNILNRLRFRSRDVQHQSCQNPLRGTSAHKHARTSSKVSKLSQLLDEPIIYLSNITSIQDLAQQNKIIKTAVQKPKKVYCSGLFTNNVIDTHIKSVEIQSFQSRDVSSVVKGLRNFATKKKQKQEKAHINLLKPFGDGSNLEGEQLQKFRIMEYRDFLWKVCFSYQIPFEPCERPRYYIGKGNNSKLLKKLMAKRWWWIRQQNQSQATFIWTQLKVFEVYKAQQSKPFKSIQYTPQEPDLSIMKIDPTLQILNNEQYQTWCRYLYKNSKRQLKNSILFQSRKCLSNSFPQFTFKSKMTNHLQYSRLIGNKKALFFTMKQYYKLSNQPCALPLTFHITGGLQDQQFLNLMSVYHQRKKNSNYNIWIVKPGEMSNRGNGITVCKQISDIKKIVCNRQRHDNGKFKTYIVQEYLCRPFLYHKRKFDIRHYMLISSINGIIKGYWYEEGYLRTTSYEYSLGELSSSVHLTNDAVQKYCKEYGKFEKGNKVSYKEFQDYLDGKFGKGTYDFQGLIDTKVKKIATDAIRAAYNCIDPNKRMNNFQIFGMDFMIDSDFRPWLIQINTNPCLQLSSPLLSKLIPSMVDNALRLCLDPVYPPPANPTKKLILDPNRFHLVFDQLSQGQALRSLYKGSQGLEQVIGNVGEDDEAYEDQSDDEL